MASSTIDPPKLDEGAQAPAAAPAAQPAPAPAPETAARSCARCSAPLAEGQDWCLHCGAGAPGSLGTSAWRPAAWTLAVALALVLGAAAAGYAALTSKAPARRVLTTTVASVPAAAAPTTGAPATSTPGLAIPKINIPAIKFKAPKIPLTAITPKVGGLKITIPKLNLPTKKTTKPAVTGGETAGEAPSGTAILLDTNAASTYNPYSLPVASFGDPSLAIDGDTSTGWSALVEPATAPKMAVGLLIDLKTAQKLAAASVVTATPGMTIQAYGANGSTPPTSITDPAWTKLTHSIVLHKRHVRLKLRESTKAFRYVVLWISKAPSSSVGTPQAPGHVSLNELELFPAQ